MPMTSPSPTAAPSPSLEYGRVLEAAPGAFHVETSFGTIRAVRAVSCLVEPGPGDKVLLSVDMTGGAYVLSVLESASALTLAVDGDARFCVRGGSLTLAADKDLALACPGEMAASAGQLRLHAGRGEAVIERVSLVGRALKTQFKRVSSVAKSVDQMFRSFTMRAQESTRFVKEHDEVQAGSQRVLVEDLCALHARNHSMIAEEHVVINADQIHMG
ncbi:DUF3540 domain-containing protein [Fundidesulfovibrio putealis]|uniref:DUF3540 domain-containing protein n=1 Tax=Fundidesulfovibrio putealis TaxID=270496 RepID=UPI000685E86F|nr:DUF3540 domain-containing protein [Fundidesulfovibrio putealis]